MSYTGDSAYMRFEGNLADTLIRTMAGRVFDRQPRPEEHRIHMPVELGNLDDVFAHHPPKGTQPAQYALIREAGKNLAKVILENTRVCADQQDAIRSVRKAVMTANGAVALEGKI